MDTFTMQFQVIDDKYICFMPDSRMPCLLADKIKDVIKDFYKDNDKED